MLTLVPSEGIGHLNVVAASRQGSSALPCTEGTPSPPHKGQDSETAPIFYQLGATLSNTEPLTLNFHSIIGGKTIFRHILSELNTNK